MPVAPSETLAVLTWIQTIALGALSVSSFILSPASITIAEEK